MPDAITTTIDDFDFTAFDIPSEPTYSTEAGPWISPLLLPPIPVTEPQAFPDEHWTLSKNFNPMSQMIYDFSVGSPNVDNMLGSRKTLGTLNCLRGRNAVAQRSASLVLQLLRTFPEKMLNNDDMPFFIHTHAQGQGLAEPLLACQRLCQIFVTRTPEIFPFIWRCIRTEEQRFLHDVSFALSVTRHDS